MRRRDRLDVDGRLRDWELRYAALQASIAPATRAAPVDVLDYSERLYAFVDELEEHGAALDMLNAHMPHRPRP